MAVRSSKNGNAKWDDTDIPESRGWTLNKGSDNKPYASSDSAGVMKRVAGHKDSSGSVRAYLDAGTDVEGILVEGDSGTFKLYEDATRFWTVPAIIDSVEVTDEIEGGEIVEVTISFSGNGAITAPA